MKERYEESRMDVVEFQVMDVIATSGEMLTTAEWVPRENEGMPDPNAFVDLS